MTDIRVGLIGYGLAGRLFHAPFITTTPGLRLTHVVTRNSADEAVGDSPQVQVVPTVDDLLSADVDLVVVASPSPLHAEHAGAALAAGKHVVLDKPPAANAEQFARLLDRAGDQLLMVFHNRRWDSEFLTLRQILAAGTLGTVHRLESRMERWRPLGKGGWREDPDPALMGGLRYDLGPHLVDQALQLFGPVETVWARTRSLREVPTVDEDVLAMLVHRSGPTTLLSASLLTQLPGPRFSAHGTAGSAVLQATDAQEAQLRAGARPGPGWGEQPDAAVVGEREIPYLPGDWPAFYAGVVTALEGGEPPVTGESALATMAVLDAMAQAAASGVTVVMD